jgi:hypothetical protein
MSVAPPEPEVFMRKALILGLGLALVGTAAWSQSSSRDDDDPSRGDYVSSRGDFGPARDDYGSSRDRYGHNDRWRGGSSRWDRNRDDDRGGRMQDDDRPGRGARFFLRSGDTQLRIVCGSRESSQACVDSALRLFDRVQSQARTGSSSPSSSGPATTPPSAQ